MTMASPLDRLHARQRKEEAFTRIKRRQLAPLQAERATLVKTLETQLAEFMAGAIPELVTEKLDPFEQASRHTLSCPGPVALAESLRRQSDSARQLCDRYEREFNIYQMAEELPVQEKKLVLLKGAVTETKRSLERLEVMLEPLAALNEKLRKAGLATVTPETAARFTRSAGAAHYARLATDRAYRIAWPVVSALEADGATLPALLQQRLALEEEALVREQETELCQNETERQRMWVEAFVVAWTSRLSGQQILAEVRQAMADCMHQPGFRAHIAACFGSRYPAGLNALFDRIEALDYSTRRFLLGFDAHYEAGRIDPSDELLLRRRAV